MGVINNKLLMSLAIVKTVTFTLPDTHIFCFFIYEYFYV